MIDTTDNKLERVRKDSTSEENHSIYTPTQHSNYEKQ